MMSRHSRTSASGPTVLGSRVIQFSIGSLGAPKSWDSARTMSRSVKIPASSSPSHTSADPMCRLAISVAASATVVAGATVVRFVLIRSRTTTTLASVLLMAGDRDARRLLPLDRARRLRRHVERHPVDPANLGDDPRRHPVQHVGGQPRPVRRHRVLAGHAADDDEVLVRPPVAHHADALDTGKHDGERLPQLVLQPRAANLLPADAVRGPNTVQAFPRHLAADPTAQPRPGERRAPHDLPG